MIILSFYEHLKICIIKRIMVILTWRITPTNYTIIIYYLICLFMKIVFKNYSKLIFESAKDSLLYYNDTL